MKKQQFLVISFPSDLKINISYNNGCADTECTSLQGYDLDQDYKITPILRPLSDLTKPITHKGETFIPSVTLRLSYPTEMIGLNPATWSFRVVLKLIEWHFNLMDESEEYIDVNTLETNPYA